MLVRDDYYLSSVIFPVTVKNLIMYGHKVVEVQKCTPDLLVRKTNTGGPKLLTRETRRLYANTLAFQALCSQACSYTAGGRDLGDRVSPGQEEVQQAFL